MNDTQIEQEIQDKGLTALRITPADIRNLMARVTYVVSSRPGNSTSTFVHAFLDGKFLLATGHSACVSPENFDAEMGRSLAQTQAEANARNALWQFEGYRLYMSQVTA